MTCAVQSYNHQLETEIELSNGYLAQFAAIPPSLNCPISCGGLQLDCLPTEDECAPVYYQQQPNATLNVLETENQNTKPATFQLPGKGWWDDSDIAPSVYKTLKEREQCLAKIEYRSPQLMSR